MQYIYGIYYADNIYVYIYAVYIDCMYSKLHSEDEQLVYSKYVEDIYWNKCKKKMRLVGSYYTNLSRCTVHIMSKKVKALFGFYINCC